MTGRTFDFILQNVPPGVSYTFDRSLQSPGTPGLIRVTFNVAAQAAPSVTDIAIHAVLDDRSLGSTFFELRIVATTLPTTAEPVSIAAGPNFSVAALADGTVRTWGDGDHGEIGLSSRMGATLPSAVPGPTGIRVVAAGHNHVLALGDDGRVWGWGSNTRGQLGGHARSADEFFSPTALSGLQDIVAVAGGLDHSLALDRNGVVWTVGYYRDLPFELISDAPPTAVPNLPAISAIVAASRQSFAVGVNGDVWHWDFFTETVLPQQVAGLSAIVAVVTEGWSQLALDRSGNVWSWGGNRFGELGDGTQTPREQPARVKDLGNVTSIAMGSGLALALTRDGEVWSWGGEENHWTPSKVAGLTGVRAIAAGEGHGLALLECGALYSWGHNSEGQLGDGSTQWRDTPLPVLGIGDDSTCARVGFHVTVASAPSDGDPIHAQPGTLEKDGPEYAGSFDRGVTVTLTAERDLVGYGPLGDQLWTFQRWALDCATNTGPIATIVLDRSKRCAAVYGDATGALLLTLVSDGGIVVSDRGLVTRNGDGVEDPPTITCPPECDAVFAAGATVQVSAQNANGFGFTEWTMDCTGTATDTTVTMDGAKTCRALFRPFNLAITVGGSGSVFSTDTAFECGSACTFQPRRAEPRLIAVPALGWRFDGWGGDCSGSNPETTVVLTGDRSCSAAFSRVPGFFLLTMIVEGTGSVSSVPAGVECSSTCVLLFAVGREFDLTAAETSQSIVSAWLDDCAGASTPSRHVVIDRDKTCRIRFGPPPPSLVAEMTWTPVSPRVGEITTFHSTSYLLDPVTNARDYSIVNQWSWSFTDGSAETSGGAFTSASAQHAFQTAGSHYAGLTVGAPSVANAADVQVVHVQEATAPLFNLNVNKTGLGHGTVNTQPAGLFHCEESCNSAALVLEAGPTLTLVATSDAQSVVTGWTGCDTVSPSGRECTVTMSADRTVTANFDPVVTGFMLTVVIIAPPGAVATIVGSSSGSVINCLAGGGPTSVCSQAFAPGTTTQVRPGPGETTAQFEGWDGCDSISGSRCNVTLNSNRTVTVRFVQ